MPRSSRRLHTLAAHVTAEAEPAPAHPPLGSLEGPSPLLRTWSVAELGGAELERCGGDGEAAAFPEPLATSHGAVEQFRRFGYVAVPDAVAPAALARATAVFRRKEPKARAKWTERLVEEETPKDNISNFYFDLNREDLAEGVEDIGSCGYLLTEPESLAALMEPLANPRIMPLLLALVGPGIHIAESNARRVPAEWRPEETGVGYTCASFFCRPLVLFA